MKHKFSRTVITLHYFIKLHLSSELVCHYKVFVQSLGFYNRRSQYLFSVLFGSFVQLAVWLLQIFSIYYFLPKLNYRYQFSILIVITKVNDELNTHLKKFERKFFWYLSYLVQTIPLTWYNIVAYMYVIYPAINVTLFLKKNGYILNIFDNMRR